MHSIYRHYTHYHQQLTRIIQTINMCYDWYMFCLCLDMRYYLNHQIWKQEPVNSLQCCKKNKLECCRKLNMYFQWERHSHKTCWYSGWLFCRWIHRMLATSTNAQSRTLWLYHVVWISLETFIVQISIYDKILIHPFFLLLAFVVKGEQFLQITAELGSS